MDRHKFSSCGTDYEILVGSGSEFDKGNLERILAFLVTGAHVQERFLRRNVPIAMVLAIAKKGDEVVSVCALKAENHDHNESIRCSSGYPLGNDVPELGYALTHKGHRRRGLGGRLNEEVMRRAPARVYATVRMPNGDEERNLKSIGFRPEGRPWQRDESQLGLWIRDTRTVADVARGASQRLRERA